MFQLVQTTRLPQCQTLRLRRQHVLLIDLKIPFWDVSVGPASLRVVPPRVQAPRSQNLTSLLTLTISSCLHLLGRPPIQSTRRLTPVAMVRLSAERRVLSRKWEEPFAGINKSSISDIFASYSRLRSIFPPSVWCYKATKLFLCNLWTCLFLYPFFCFPIFLLTLFHYF